MTEEFLHYIWKYRLFDQQGLSAYKGEIIEVIMPGEHNTDAGPDFFDARIKINGWLWAGNVEIHVNASDWIRHGHGKDGAYDNIILHVVYEQDQEIRRKNNEIIPALELKNRLDKKTYAKYLQLRSARDWIPCGRQAAAIDSILINAWLDRLVAERLEAKSQLILERLERNKNNWNETFYHLLARGFGFKTNAEPFELLARSLPLHVIARHSDNPFQVEALLFGQAGLLNGKFREHYPQKLQKEYHYLRHKFSLTPIDAHLWKFLRLRPSGFPSIRIAQFASQVCSATHIFSKILEAGNINALKKQFGSGISGYWKNHYVFGKRSPSREKEIGDDAVTLLIINTIIPFLFAYGKSHGEEKFVSRAFEFLEEIRGERNAIIAGWKKLGMPVNSALHTQALLQLKKNYCDHTKCLECAIGNKLLSG